MEWFENTINEKKDPLVALNDIVHTLWDHDEDDVIKNLSTGRDTLELFVTTVYSHSSDTVRNYEVMMTGFVRKCRDKVEKKKEWSDHFDRYIVVMVESSFWKGTSKHSWGYKAAMAILDIFEESISWVRPSESAHVDVHNVEEEEAVYQRDVREANIAESISKDRDTDGKTRKRVLGVLRSFPRISIADLSKYSGLSLDASRDLLFELLGDNLVSGRFDAATDEFISAPAATASKEIKSDSLSLARCQFCGKSLGKAPISGEEITCSSCGMLNVG